MDEKGKFHSFGRFPSGYLFTNNFIVNGNLKEEGV